MKKFLFLALFPIIFLQLSFFVLIPAQAQVDPTDLSKQQGFSGDSSISNAFGQGSTPTDVRTIVINIIKIALEFIGIIFVALLVYAGFKYMTSAGNEEQTGQAKKLIIQASIGLAIILSAYAITVFISTYIQQATNGTFTPGSNNNWTEILPTKKGFTY